jgi:hypothetical protein
MLLHVARLMREAIGGELTLLKVSRELSNERPIFKVCLQGEWQQGLMPRQWWWEQPRCFDAIDAIGSDANDGQLDAPDPVDA